jgi:hypothetical protein
MRSFTVAVVHPWLRQAHHLPERLGRRMNLGGHHERALRGELELLDHRWHRDEALVNGKISTFRILDEPLVGVGIAPENEIESLPLQAEADRAI